MRRPWRSKGKRVAALVGDGFEESELLEPKRALEEAGAVVTIVGVDDRAVQKIRGKKGLDEGQSVKAEEIVADVTADDFDALLVPGGQSPDHLRMNKDVQRFVREFDTAKKPMFVICHGPQILISAQLVRGRTLTGYASIADDIRNAGGLYRDQPVVNDGNWVTSRNPGDLMLFNRAILEKLASAGSSRKRYSRSGVAGAAPAARRGAERPAGVGASFPGDDPADERRDRAAPQRNSHVDGIRGRTVL